MNYTDPSGTTDCTVTIGAVYGEWGSDGTYRVTADRNSLTCRGDDGTGGSGKLPGGTGGGGQPAQPPKPQPPKLHCPQRSQDVRSQLQGVPLESNIRRAYELRGQNPVSRLWSFYQLVRNGGDFDIKLRGGVNSAALQYGGNWHFGVVGRAAGYSEGFLAWGAGLYQWKTELGSAVKYGVGSPFPNTTTGVVAWPFGDDPRDQLAMEDGFVYANACGIR